MTLANNENSQVALRPFDFECYGVKIRLDGNDQRVIDEAELVTRKALLNDIRPPTTENFDTTFTFTRDATGTIFLSHDCELIEYGDVPEYFFNHFNSLIRVAVAERAVDRLFIHAGAVGWKGKAIILPGTSFVGKSTLVAELVRNGAVYYSDDYAIFDREGLLYPFPRTLSMRADDENYTRFELTPSSLGGMIGTEPIAVGMVLLTEYKPDAKWEPQSLTAGSGALEMVPFTFSFVNRPDFSLGVLNNILSRAIIVSSQRGSADNFAKTLLDFVDKHVN
ncbi:MAG TPA: hypothetical protein PLL77_14580 [Pyrinomonadaceae bacterium]|nr:hypothetical protein [Pyrinomonadaceae bacterium]